MRKGTLLILMGLLLVAAAFFLTGYNLVEDYLAAESAKEAAAQLEAMLPAEQTVTAEPIQTEPQEPLEIPDYILNPGMPMPEKTVEGCNYIGILEIPCLELKLPVLTSWSYDLLQIAPCRYEGSVYTHDLIISAHNYQHHFGKLNQLISGDRLIFTDMDGNIFVYEVAYRESLGGNEGAAMGAGEWDMTLFTCTVGGEYRVTVRCELVEEIPNI